MLLHDYFHDIVAPDRTHHLITGATLNAWLTDQSLDRHLDCPAAEALADNGNGREIISTRHT